MTAANIIWTKRASKRLRDIVERKVLIVVCKARKYAQESPLL